MPLDSTVAMRSFIFWSLALVVSVSLMDIQMFFRLSFWCIDLLRLSLFPSYGAICIPPLVLEPGDGEVHLAHFLIHFFIWFFTSPSDLFTSSTRDLLARTLARTNHTHIAGIEMNPGRDGLSAWGPRASCSWPRRRCWNGQLVSADHGGQFLLGMGRNMSAVWQTESPSILRLLDATFFSKYWNWMMPSLSMFSSSWSRGDKDLIIPTPWLVSLQSFPQHSWSWPLWPPGFPVSFEFPVVFSLRTVIATPAYTNRTWRWRPWRPRDMLHGKTYGTCVLWQELWAKTATENDDDYDDDDGNEIKWNQMKLNESKWNE